MVQVVAGGVFMQGMEMGNQFAVWQDNFQSDDQIAHRAVTQYVQSAGIAGDIAADLARAFAGETEREQPAGSFCRLLYGFKDAARFDGHTVVRQVDIADFVELGKVQQYAVFRYCRAAQTGIAALRRNRNAVFVTKTHNGLHAFDAARLQNDVWCRRKAVALIF
ncbi:hypothetical protein NEILACOT_04002 [Neisseria lactamica ATCC 23970]|uniref:Uncharacterized protein n=1 Tax=Neisseria lactamica ATCC 23970 TaxID=546265 RepID=D0W8Z7_NEILA|nr:hypothetical protein NEILACOT_04002 [Neisseria lactamica ATCC 23970]